MPPNNTPDLSALAEAGHALDLHDARLVGEEYIESSQESPGASADSLDSFHSGVEEQEESSPKGGEKAAANGSSSRSSRVAFGWDNHVDLETGDGQVLSPTDEEDGTDRKLSSLQIRRFIRHKSSLLLKDNREIEVDEERLSRAVHDAGQYAFGIIGVEVWELDQEDGSLKLPKGGWWRHPHLNESEDLERLENFAHPNYSPANPCMPGVGLPGTLWFESEGVRRMRRYSSTARSLTNLASLGNAQESPRGLGGSGAVAPLNSTGNLAGDHTGNVVRWRDIKSLLVDPDTAKEERLGLRYDAGFRLAAGVPFETGGSKGIVVFLARERANRGQALLSTENQAYMLRASELIGAVVASTDARRACVVHKKFVCSNACRKARRSLGSTSSKGSAKRRTDDKSSNLPSPTNEEQYAQKLAQAKKFFSRRLVMWMKKCQGGDLQAPPAMTFRQAAWTWIGCFIGLLILSTMNEYARKLSDDEYLLLIGPFGALMTLQYGLTAAPASQPRNVVLGQAIAGAVSLSFTYIPESMLSTWMRRAVGPAFSIATMLKLGIPHPPAGAHSVIYASGQFGWMFYFLVVLASIISVIPATLVNNMSEKRQYPTYWVKRHTCSSYMPKALRRKHGETK